jgi:hypothetical protein
MKSNKLEKTSFENVYLRNFWPIGTVGHVSNLNQDEIRNFLASFAATVCGKRKVVIDSHFGSTNPLKKIYKRLSSTGSKKRYLLHETETTLKKELDALHFWYTSENKRPPLSLDYNLFLTHDFDDYDGRNLYLPFWAAKLGGNIEESTKKQIKFFFERTVPQVPRNFACAVISNPEPLRMEFIRQLSKIGQVDVYGNLGIKLERKSELFRKYRFNICFENSRHPGYVTEKPFEAWELESIPVWDGIDQGNYLNRDGLINVTEIGFNNSLSEISHLENNHQLIQEMLQKPILQKKYDYDGLVNQARIKLG